jgi:hypothetical protein
MMTRQRFREADFPEAVLDLDPDLDAVADSRLPTDSAFIEVSGTGADGAGLGTAAGTGAGGGGGGA